MHGWTNTSLQLSLHLADMWLRVMETDIGTILAPIGGMTSTWKIENSDLKNILQSIINSW